MTQEHAALFQAEGHFLYLSQRARSFRVFNRLGRFSTSLKCRTTTAVLIGEATTVGEAAAAAAMEATATGTTAMVVETATVAEIAMAVEEALVDTESKSKFRYIKNKGEYFFVCFVFEYVVGISL